MSFPPPPPTPTDPPAPGPSAPGRWQPAPLPPYGQQPYPPHPPQPPAQPYAQQPYPPQPPDQPYSRQPYAAQPAAPLAAAPPAGRGWVVPTVVVTSLVAIAGVFAASAARESQDSADAATDARDAVVRLTDAMHQGDCAGVEAASTGGYFRAMNLTCDDITANGAWMDEVGMSFVIGDAEVDGDTADVPVEIVVTSDPSQGGNGYFTVVRTGDSWRVSNDQSR